MAVYMVLLRAVWLGIPTVWLYGTAVCSHTVAIQLLPYSYYHTTVWLYGTIPGMVHAWLYSCTVWLYGYCMPQI